MAKQLTIDGVQYKNPTKAAMALVAAGKTIAEAAAATGISYQTVYANTKGADKVNVRRAKYRVLAMGKTGKRSPGEIAKKVRLNVSKVVAILKGAKITVVTKEAKDASKKVKKASKQKIVKSENVIKVPEPVTETVDEPVIDEIPTNEAAMAAALKDMEAANQ